MFVKIIHTVDGKHSQDVYECDNASSWFEDESTTLCLRLNMGFRLDVKVDGSQVYYLNKLGKTIDKVL